MRDGLDGDLLQLFEEKNSELPEEPFRAELRLRIEKTRIGYGRIYWIFTAIALAVCAAVSDLVIDGVTLFCGELNRVLQIAGELFVVPVGGAGLAIPAGLIFVTAAALLSLLYSRAA